MNAVLVLYPLEALVFNYLSFGFFTVVNSVWTWAAVITAAVSFWRFKPFSTLPAAEPRRGDISSHVLISPSPLTPTVVTTSSSSQVERVSSQFAPNESSFSALGNNEEGTKGKLMVYFKQDEEGEHNSDRECRDQEGEGNAIELCEEWFENWERLLKLKNGEMGWYSYQDMKVIDGNIVRLWDGSRRRRNAEVTTFSVGIITTCKF